MIVKKMLTLLLLFIPLTLTAQDIVAQAITAQEPQQAPASAYGFPLVDILDSVASNLNKTIFTESGFDSREKVQVFGKTLAQLDYGDLLRILKLHGYTAFEAEDSINIIDINKVRNQAVPMVVEGVDYYPDQYVTKIINLEKSCAVQVLPVVRPMIAQYAHFTAVHDSNALIIVDNFANVERIEAIMMALEKTTKKKQDCTAFPKRE